MYLFSRSHALEAMADLIKHHVENQNFVAALEVDMATSGMSPASCFLLTSIFIVHFNFNRRV